MDTKNIVVPDFLSSYVKNILVFTNELEGKIDVMAFYADGNPGILYRESQASPLLKPSDKSLSPLFLYGQTIKPIEIHFHAPYKVIVFELHPFTVKMIFGLNPKELNDNCFDFLADKAIDDSSLLSKLESTVTIDMQIELIAEFLKKQITKQSSNPHHKIKLALDLMVFHNGNIHIKKVAEEIEVSERTLQRLFMAYVGVSPKQFAKIIQFKSSLAHISEAGLKKLTDVVYANGFSDQSHFIRDFKKYTGSKPSEHKRKD
ncbi:MAG: AraC family transcriptional regulator [Pedobacter sp.]|nr:MAG: AraC family transcriptional regulator [Pedobacter sp.]